MTDLDPAQRGSQEGNEENPSSIPTPNERGGRRFSLKNVLILSVTTGLATLVAFELIAIGFNISGNPLLEKAAPDIATSFAPVGAAIGVVYALAYGGILHIYERIAGEKAWGPH